MMSFEVLETVQMPYVARATDDGLQLALHEACMHMSDLAHWSLLLQYTLFQDNLFSYHVFL